MHSLTWQIVVLSINICCFESTPYSYTHNKKKICCAEVLPLQNGMHSRHKIELFIPRIELWIMFGVYLLSSIVLEHGPLFHLQWLNTCMCCVCVWYHIDLITRFVGTMVGIDHIVITIKSIKQPKHNRPNENRECAIITWNKWRSKFNCTSLSDSNRLYVWNHSQWRQLFFLLLSDGGGGDCQIPRETSEHTLIYGITTKNNFMVLNQN